MGDIVAAGVVGERAAEADVVAEELARSDVCRAGEVVDQVARL
jgi:hypothetical protein